MISERKFANSFSSFWNELLPIADTFVRRINLSLDRFYLPFESTLESNRDIRAVINELSFRLFINMTKKNELSKTDTEVLINEVINYIKRLATNIVIDKPLSSEEYLEAQSLSYSLSNYFTNKEYGSLSFWPTFRGCGKLHACKGDILCNKTLIEVKAGDRLFRVTDIRQIIIYLSLNSISKQYNIENVALVNPRKGLAYKLSVDSLIRDCSRRKPVDVFGDIIDFLSAEILSN